VDRWQGTTIALAAYIGGLFYFFDFKWCFVKVLFGKKLSSKNYRQKTQKWRPVAVKNLMTTGVTRGHEKVR
jgi:hypothetical protein